MDYIFVWWINRNFWSPHQYAGIVLILFIAEVVLGILILVYTDQAESIVTDSMKLSFNAYGGDDKSLTKSLDVAQHDVSIYIAQNILYCKIITWIEVFFCFRVSVSLMLPAYWIYFFVLN